MRVETWYGRRVTLNTPAKPPPRKLNPKQAREDMAARARAAPMPADPLSVQALKPIALRAGIPLVLLWVLAIVLNGWWWKAIMGVLTLALAGVLLWAFRYASRSRKVAGSSVAFVCCSCPS